MHLFLLQTLTLGLSYFGEREVKHCVKTAQIRSFFWSVFSHTQTEYGDLPARVRENTDQKKLRIWTFHAVKIL